MSTSVSRDRTNAGEHDVPRVDREAGTSVLHSHILFGNNKEVAIRHEGQLYRLRITRHGKLILNK